jgi:Ring finger domain
MPISRKRFSFSKNKKSVKKSVKSKKNTRKHKKTTPRRKNRKSGKRFRFFGGNGDEDICVICTDPLANGKEIFTTICGHKYHVDCIKDWCSRSQNCKCPLCNAVLNPNPFPPPPNVFPAFANNTSVVEYPNLYRVEFFKFQQNPSTREIEKVKISVHDMTDETINSLNGYFMRQIPGLTNEHLDFFGDPARVNPNGYINLYNNPTGVEIPLGDMDVNVANIDSATITQTNTHN